MRLLVRLPCSVVQDTSTQEISQRDVKVAAEARVDPAQWLQVTQVIMVGQLLRQRHIACCTPHTKSLSSQI